MNPPDFRGENPWITIPISEITTTSPFSMKLPCKKGFIFRLNYRCPITSPATIVRVHWLHEVFIFHLNSASSSITHWVHIKSHMDPYYPINSLMKSLFLIVKSWFWWLNHHSSSVLMVFVGKSIMFWSNLIVTVNLKKLEFNMCHKSTFSYRNPTFFSRFAWVEAPGRSAWPAPPRRRRRWNPEEVGRLRAGPPNVMCVGLYIQWIL